MATLLGLDPPDPTGGRLLEPGCAAGGNLVAMGVELPDASFVGVDLSGRQIDEGRETVEALAIGNVDLRHVSITDVDASVGQFDFVKLMGPAGGPGSDAGDLRRATAARRACYVSYNT